MTWEVTAEVPEVTVRVNGEEVDTIDASTTLKEAIDTTAREHGLRTVSVTVNGSVVEPRDGAKTLAALHATVLEIRTKDQRA